MYKFREPVTKAAIENRLSDYQIYKYYYPALEIGRVVISPLRKEKNASFGIFKARDGKLKYNDLASQDSGDVYSFVQRMFNLSFNDALHKIAQDFNLDLAPNRRTTFELPKTKGTIVENISVQDRQKHKIDIIPRKWTMDDQDYWKKFGLSLPEVHESNTRPIVAYRINDGTTILADKLAYSLEFYDDGDGIMMRKIYQPYNKEVKWRTNLTSNVVDGIKELPEIGNLLIITKSRKDRLVLKHYGYNAIATNSESTFIPATVFEKLQRRFTRLVLFFDSDAAGKKNSEAFSKKYEIDKIEIDTNWEVSDIAEYRERYGDNNTKTLLQWITKNYTKETVTQ